MYKITRNYIRHGDSRSGHSIEKVRFIVSHDTGNPGSTAHGNRNWFDRDQPLASAHTFIDDTYILEIIPLTEKAWHVRYNQPQDNRLFGYDANNSAIGVELCHGGKINFEEAYKRYVWYHAYLCKRFDLNPLKDIVAHATLDPGRKVDPIQVLRNKGISWTKFINDVDEMCLIVKANVELIEEEDKVSVYKRGDKSAGVLAYQEDLKLAGYEINADGSFGPETETVTKQFQKDNNLIVDGIAGPQTLSAIDELLMRKDPPLRESVIFFLGKERYILGKL